MKSNVDFLVIGGGWYGAFYVRQLLRLLRGTSRVGLGRLHVVDHDTDCLVKREFKELIEAPNSPIVFHHRDWKKFLAEYFEELLLRADRGEEIQDQYAPPCLAPHILLELFLEKAQKDIPHLTLKSLPLDSSFQTPVDMALPGGARALSFATWICPYSCIEPPTCPHTRGPKSWDMKTTLERMKEKKEGVFAGPVPVDSLHVFQCLHYAMGVGTIPMRSVVEEYLHFQEVMCVPGTHLSVVATVSSCHGLVGLVEAKNG